jgi:hypothetical protein
MLVTYQAVPIPRVTAPDLAASLALQVAQADGSYFSASALSSVVGCLLAGCLPARWLNAINWMPAAAGGCHSDQGSCLVVRDSPLLPTTGLLAHDTER